MLSIETAASGGRWTRKRAKSCLRQGAGRERFGFAGCGLGAARGLAYIAHVVDMKADEFAEEFFGRCAELGRRLTAIDLAHGSGCPAPCCVGAQEGLADVAHTKKWPPTLNSRPVPGVSKSVAKVATVCTERSKCREKGRILAKIRLRSAGVNNLMLRKNAEQSRS